MIITTIHGETLDLHPGVSLDKAMLRNQVLDGIDLSGSHLTGCFFNESSLVGANLSDCDLTGAVFFAADLRGADLSGSRVEDCYWNNVIHDKDTLWPIGFTPPTKPSGSSPAKSSGTKTSKPTRTPRSAAAGTTADTGAAPKMKAAAAELEQIMAELDSMVGLDSVKTLLSDLVQLQRMNLMLHRATRTSLDISPHLVFTGSPGTGKTSVARLVGRAYKAVGLLPKGHFIEAERRDLVAGYIGHTAIQTAKLCQKALGGVLFIDEAYSLAGDEKDFGHEAVETLMTFMENNRGKLAVIIAGYPDQMSRFLSTNPGLRSRFDESIHFPDYSDDELCTILGAIFDSHRLTVEPEARERLRRLVQGLPRDEHFGNAREMRRLFSQVMRRHARLLASEPDRHDLLTITAADIPDETDSDRGSLMGAGAGYL